MVAYDFVRDLGATPDGSTPCGNALAAIDGLDGDVTIRFPEGSYFIPPATHTLDGPERLTLKTPSGDNAAFVTPADFEDILLDFQTPVEWRNIDINRNASGSGPQIRLETREESVIEDVIVNGRDETYAEGGGLFVVEAKTDRSRIVLRRITSLDGTYWYQPGQGDRAFVRAVESSVGTLRVEDCDIGGYSGGGIVNRESQGTLEVVGGSVRNCDGGQIQCGNEGTTIRDVTLIGDPASGSIDAPDYRNLCGVLIDPVHPASAGLVTIEDTTIELITGDNPNVRGCIEAEATAWGFAVEGGRFRVDLDGVPTISVNAPDSSVGTPSKVVLRELICSGSSMSGTAIDLPRPDSVIEDCCIETPGTRQGLAVPAGVELTRTDLKERCWR